MHHHHHDDSSTRIGWAFFLNLGFTIIEFIGGVLTNSTAILADAVHDLGDSLSLGFAWILQKVSGKQANDRFSYGYKRLSLVGAFVNALVLLIGSIWILTEAIPRLWAPEMPVVEGMIGLAVLGVIVNGYAAFKLSKGKTLNERVLNWHLLEDVLGWVAVLIVALILSVVELPILDPLLSIAFTLFILFNVLRHFWSTVQLFVQATPDPHLYAELNLKLRELHHVSEVHHLHLWSLDGEAHVLTAHLTLAKELSTNQRHTLKQAVDKVLKPYALAHTTIELESPDELCRDQSDADQHEHHV